MPALLCDVPSGDLVSGACTARSIVVDSTGRVRVALEAGTAVAIHVGARP